MKVVLFCGGLGTRIREYSEAIPKPMVPVGHQPIMCHVMQYYSQYGHDDFILCLGYKANVIKDYFLNYRQTANSDCVISEFGKKVEILGDRPPDWRVSLVDTGTWRNIGERLMAVKHLVKDEEIFDFIKDGEELVLEPFNRLIEGGHLMAYKYEGFWRAMDTLRDRQVLEDMVERGDTPWRIQQVLPDIKAA